MQSSNVPSKRYFFSDQETKDVTDFKRAIVGWDGELDQVECGTFHGRVTELSLGSVQVLRERINQPFAYRGTSKKGSLNVISLMPSTGVLSFGGRKVVPNSLVAIPWDFSDRIFSSGPIEAITVTIEEALFTSYLYKTLGRAVSPAFLRQGLSIADATGVSRFQACVAQILLEVAAQPKALEIDGRRADLRERVLQSLAGVLESDATCPRRLPPPSTRSYVVDRAIRYMDARLADPVVISDVCEAVRVCPRTLRYCFEEIFGVSPMRYLLARRLGSVRRDLLQGTATHGVLRIAEQYGFCHPSRFAKFYRQAYGERPSETGRRANIRDSLHRSELSLKG